MSCALRRFLRGAVGDGGPGIGRDVGFLPGGAAPRHASPSTGPPRGGVEPHEGVQQRVVLARHRALQHKLADPVREVRRCVLRDQQVQTWYLDALPVALPAR